MFSYVSLEERIPADHPLRPLHAMVDRALVMLSSRCDALYVDWGRPSIPPEQLLRALLRHQGVCGRLRAERVTPHVAQNETDRRSSGIDARTT